VVIGITDSIRQLLLKLSQILSIRLSIPISSKSDSFFNLIVMSISLLSIERSVTNDPYISTIKSLSKKLKLEVIYKIKLINFSVELMLPKHFLILLSRSLIMYFLISFINSTISLTE